MAGQLHSGENASGAGGSVFGAKDRSELLDIIRARSFRTGDFTLASGRKSTLYFNMKPTMMAPRGGALVARGFLAIMEGTDAEYVSGLEMGAVPAIGAMAAVSEELGRPVRTTFVRKRKKDYGTQDVIEGLASDETVVGRKVFVIDDVATSGGSILKAAEEIRAAGGIVTDAAAIVDRLEGGSELLGENGITLHAILTARDFTS